MTLGGFTSLVRITEAEIGGGFGDGGKPFTNGEMKLEGKLLELHFGDYEGRIPKGVDISTYIRVSFTESQERLWDLESTPEAYMGKIQHDSSESILVFTLALTLPIIMFQQVLALGDKNILFDTIHDKVQKPSEREKADHIVAYVKRVYFQRTFS